jgi:hypothetical protein
MHYFLFSLCKDPVTFVFSACFVIFKRVATQTLETLHHIKILTYEYLVGGSVYKQPYISALKYIYSWIVMFNFT